MVGRLSLKMISILLKLKPAVLFLAIPLLQKGTISEGYRGIVPLRTTRSQVEKLLGPSKTLDNLSTYYFQNETIEIFYSMYRCGDSRDLDKWNVSPNTVISVIVIPKTKFPLAELPFDFSKFRKESGSFDALDESRLINDEDGITLTFSSTHNIIIWYAYGPKARDRHLRCPNYSEEEAAQTRNCLPATLQIDCAAQVIRRGKSVQCKASSDAPQPSFEWTVSSGASFMSDSKRSIVVNSTSRKPKRIKVTVTILSPKVCISSASAELTVVKSNRRR
jgi:hypothetical protein